MTEYEKNIEVMKDLRSRIDKVLAGESVVQEVGYRHPDPIKHKYISFAKSAIRIVAGGCLISGNFVFAGIGFVLAEILGIVEEIV
jgi:hypothetical protein